MNFPLDFELRMRLQLGDNFQNFKHAHDELPSVSIRTNPNKYRLVNQEQKVPWTEFGYYLETRPSFTLDPLFHGGAYYVQEASSMFLEQALVQHVPKTKEIRVLDLCAAPGGKSTHLLSLLSDRSLLVSNEVIRSRVNVLLENIQKWGSPNIVITNNDAADFSALENFFDLIVLDAPCSGEGLFRKDPAAALEWSEQNVNLCAGRQRRIMEDVWPALKNDGLLIYSTCTYSEQENEDNLGWISHDRDVEFLPLETDPKWNVEEIKKGKVIAYRFFPHRVKGEGFFISIMRKSSGPKGDDEHLHRGKAKNEFTIASNKIREKTQSWFNNRDLTLIQRNDLLQLLPTQYLSDIFALTKALRVIYSGVFVAMAKHEKLVPEHSFALSTAINNGAFNQVEFTVDHALQYLRKENLRVDQLEKGYALATYKGIPLGWMNIIPGRINNLYPSEWRIRMR